MIELNNKIVFKIFQNFLVFAFTYSITILCVFMFESDDYIIPLMDTIAVTTITYSLSIIIKNLFTKCEHIMYCTVCSIGVVILHIIIYVASRNGIFSDTLFWILTFISITFSLISEMELVFCEYSVKKREKMYDLFSG